ncbi:hypothetical protein CIG19_00860 [Enterobacterales bacterium CwR94]|nr:hypothetical protein CIG19_00860 [Enterobacterales bacterium CwR94]
MPHYCFYRKGQHITALNKSDTEGALRLIQQGYAKQFEAVSAADENHALARYRDIHKSAQIDKHNFLAGAGAMPLIGVLIAAATALLRKK